MKMRGVGEEEAWWIQGGSERSMTSIVHLDRLTLYLTCGDRIRTVHWLIMCHRTIL